jgi:hypothetical protein
MIFQLRLFLNDSLFRLFELISALLNELDSRINFEIMLNKSFLNLIKFPKCPSKYNGILQIF